MWTVRLFWQYWHCYCELKIIWNHCQPCNLHFVESQEDRNHSKNKIKSKIAALKVKTMPLCYTPVKPVGLRRSSAHLVMSVGDRLLKHGDPVLRLVALTHFQHVASDGTPPLIQRRLPQQHQGAVPHLPELQVVGTTWAGQTKKQARRPWALWAPAGQITPVLKIAPHTEYRYMSVQ